jgi:hypothetical protein
MTEVLMKLRAGIMYLNIVKSMYDKPITNIILNGKKLKPFILKPGMRHRCPLLYFYLT